MIKEGAGSPRTVTIKVRVLNLLPILYAHYYNWQDAENNADKTWQQLSESFKSITTLISKDKLEHLLYCANMANERDEFKGLLGKSFKETVDGLFPSGFYEFDYDYNYLAEVSGKTKMTEEEKSEVEEYG